LPVIIKTESLGIRDQHVSIKAKGFHCTTCQLAFKYWVHLKHHESTSKKCAVHFNQNYHVKVAQKKALMTPQKPSGVLSCPECKKEFKKQYVFRAHMTAHHNKEKPFVCSKCLKTFKWKREFVLHTRRDHWLNCEECELSFIFNPGLQRHVNKCHRGYITKETECSDIKARTYACLQCPKAFTRKWSLQYHTRKKHGLKCANCKLLFIDGLHLEKHELKCYAGEIRNKDCDFNKGRRRKVHSCPECKKQFHRSTNLSHHMIVHSNEEPFVCSKCLKAFKWRRAFRAHTRTEHRFNCEECQLSFVVKPGLERHVNKCHRGDITKECSNINARPYACSQCPNKFTLKRSLECHTRNTHGFQCTNCDVLFVDELSCERHELKCYAVEIRNNDCDFNKYMNNSSRNQRLPNCYPDSNISVSLDGNTVVQTVGERTTAQSPDAGLSREKALMNHCKKPNMGPRKVIACPECGKEFNRSSNLRKHMMFHSNSKKRLHVCFLCQKVCQNKLSLTLHSQTEHKFECTDCELSFVYKLGLEKHSVKDHQTVPVQMKYSCHECKKEFSRRNNLRDHMIVHSKEMPYVCLLCRKLFKKRGGLKLHSLWEHKFKCPDCELLFVCKIDLEKHTVKDHQIVPVQMKDSSSECNTEISSSRDLRVNVVVDNNETPHVCLLCRKMYKTEFALNHHGYTEHKFMFRL